MVDRFSLSPFFFFTPRGNQKKKSEDGRTNAAPPLSFPFSPFLSSSGDEEVSQDHGKSQQKRRRRRSVQSPPFLFLTLGGEKGDRCFFFVPSFSSALRGG